MIILGIETSCDETALAIIEAKGDINSPVFNVLGNVILSQAKLHEQYGGVFPNLARREHAKNLMPLFEKVLKDSEIFRMTNDKFPISKNNLEAKNLQVTVILEKEPELLKQFLELIPTLEKPPIDLIAVTQGPGLEPALWVGISFAKALGEFWNIPVLPVNHMEGHLTSVLLQQNKGEVSRIKNEKFGIKDKKIEFPALALLISGGHTELVLVEKWGSYKKIGQTRDDAVGEAFDKVARILGLPYPGGPEISRLASQARKSGFNNTELRLPRPMLHSKDLDFSFSGLKTAVLYGVEKNKPLTEEKKRNIACEFENAAIDVLLSKTKKAVDMYSIKNLIVAGGVSANKQLQIRFTTYGNESDIALHLPKPELTGDNAVMIAIASYIENLLDKKIESYFEASGNLSL